MNENLSLGRIAGIHVGLNWSLLVIAFLIASSLVTNLLPSAAPGRTSSAYWTAGIVSAFVYLACLPVSSLNPSSRCDALSGLTANPPNYCGENYGPPPPESPPARQLGAV